MSAQIEAIQSFQRISSTDTLKNTTEVGVASPETVEKFNQLMLAANTVQKTSQNEIQKINATEKTSESSFLSTIKQKASESSEVWADFEKSLEALMNKKGNITEADMINFQYGLVKASITHEVSSKIANTVEKNTSSLLQRNG